jgi:AraC family transcriptional regulator
MNAIGKALWYIESHSTGPVTLDEVAEASGLSRFHLSRTFAAVVGQSPSAYLRARRLTEAARTLATGAPDILSVALDAGYGSHEAFTRAFRDQFGVTPEQVRASRILETLALVEPIRMTDAPVSTIAPPKFQTAGPLLIAGMRKYFRFEDRGGIPALWGLFGPHIGNIPGGIPGVTYGVCLAPVDGAECGFDYVAGVGVKNFDELPEGLTGIRLPQHEYAIFRHAGHVSSVGATCAAIYSEWLPSSGRKQAEGPLQMIERYGPEFNPRTGLGGLEIWGALKP